MCCIESLELEVLHQSDCELVVSCVISFEITLETDVDIVVAFIITYHGGVIFQDNPVVGNRVRSQVVRENSVRPNTRALFSVNPKISSSESSLIICFLL